ncbi:MAG: NusA N-terminal domain-containing protein, partial [Patescibacteria group bacterium]
MNLKELVAAVEQVAEEKGIRTDRAFAAVEQALAAAYKKEYRNRSEVIRASLNPKTGELQFWQVKTVVRPEEVRVVEEDAGGQHEGHEQRANNANLLQPPEEKIDIPLGPDGEPLPRYNPDRHIFLEEAREYKPGVQAGDDVEFPLQPIADFGRIAAQTAKQVILQALREAEKESIQSEYADKEGEIVSGVIQRFERGSVYVDMGRAIGVLFQNE